VLRATLLALASAGLHAGWNLVAKRSADRYIALWGQFAAAGLLGAAVLLAFRGLPAEAWLWAAVCGVVHVPYVVGLALAYDHGDFSTAYPIARGSGALLAGVGGIVLLGDELSGLAIAAIVVVAGGICLLAASARGNAWPALGWALLVGVSIGVYTINDSHAARTIDGGLYPFAAFVMIGVVVTVHGVVVGRRRDMLAATRTDWRKFLATGAAAAVTYVLVLVAVRTAPVGYVAALRESSVLIASLLGARVLAEEDSRRRAVAAAIILAGLVLLIATA
jgi:drug/metabolite transporter (DMT)-like permease